MKNKAIKIIREFISQGEWGSYIVILPTQYLVDDFIDTLLNDGVQGVLYPKFFTFESFVDEILKGKAAIYIDDMVKLDILGQVLDVLIGQDKLDYFQGLISYGVINYIGEAISELKHNLITPDLFKQAVLSCHNPRLNDLALIYTSYEKQLQRKGFRDKEEGFLDVLEIIKNDDSVLATVEYAYIDWFFDNTPLQEQLFSAILARVAHADANLGLYGLNGLKDIPTKKNPKNHIANLIFTPTEVKARSPHIGIFNRNGLEDEVRSVLHEVIRLLEDGVRPDDIAIVARNPQDYGDILFKLFNEIGLNLQLKSLKPLMTNQLIKSIFLWLDLAVHPKRPFSLATLLNNHYLSEQFTDKDLIIDWSMRNGIKATNKWLDLWEAEGKEISNSSYEDVNNLLKEVKDWQDLLLGNYPKADIISAIIANLQQLNLAEKSQLFPEGIDLETRFSIYYRDMEALNSFTDLLTNLQLAGAGDQRKTDLAGVVSSVKEYVDSIYYRERPSHSAGIKVLSPTEIRGLAFHTVFVLGMEQNVFPRLVAQNPFLRDRERLMLKSTFYLPLASDVYEREKILFYLILQASQKELILTYSDVNEEGEKNLPSLFVEDVLHLTVENDLISPYLPTLNPIKINSRLKHLLQVEDFRNSSLFSEYEGCFKERKYKQELASKAQKQLYSISKLNLYAKCPLKYFLMVELGLDDDPIARDRLTSLDLGRLKHEVLARTMQSSTRLKSENVPELIRQIISQVCQENGWQGEEYPTEWLWELEKHEIAVSLTDLVLRELGRGDFKPAYLEWSFGFDQAFILESGEDKVGLRGVIDRIDTDNAGHYAVYDYKERASMRRYDVENAKELQLPVYIMAVEDLLGEVAGTAYIEIKSGSLKHFFYNDGYKSKLGFATNIKGLTTEEWQAWLGTIKEQIIEYYNNIQKGIFP
ncbi:MAG TPA: PD-(D/E)XK nuclease family protein, partial [Syntrophomonadaceae bacterium]|nr:PD-(D/E)XK nuclease family protein [Syntrophomonadaceae bacterium]